MSPDRVNQWFTQQPGFYAPRFLVDVASDPTTYLAAGSGAVNLARPSAFLSPAIRTTGAPIGIASRSTGAPIESLLRANAKRISTAGFTEAQKGAYGELRTSLTMRRAGFDELAARLSGNQGFDGVFVRHSASGSIADIVITESKFASDGKLRLDTTRGMGRQLSPQWIDGNIQRMLNSSDPAIVRTGMTLDANRSLIRAKAAVTNANGVQRFSSP